MKEAGERPERPPEIVDWLKKVVQKLAIERAYLGVVIAVGHFCNNPSREAEEALDQALDVAERAVRQDKAFLRAYFNGTLAPRQKTRR